MSESHKEFGPVYSREVVNALVDKDLDSLQSLASTIGGYAISRVHDSYDKLAYIEILSDMDMPERELKHIYQLLGLTYPDESPQTYSLEEIDKLFGYK
ncbi:MAG TPA: hypothetical protein PKD68_03330 [Candidatus Saccharibacteria bacterium]|nr:hypothetical protein [Candidatus Saccharibacteria bacterium]